MALATCDRHQGLVVPRVRRPDVAKGTRERRIRMANDVTISRMNATPKSLETEIGEQIVPQSNGCWLWRDQPDMYGDTSVQGIRIRRMHVWVYELLVGPVPTGWHLHHECETPGCVNPAHLMPLSPGDHMARHRAWEKMMREDSELPRTAT